VVVVFNDGQLNLIRRQQVRQFGLEAAVRLRNPDYRVLAEAIGCSYFAAAEDLESVVRDVLATPGLRLVELRLADTPAFRLQQVRSVVRERVRPLAPAGVWRVLKSIVAR
jgi:thiamine pyrophosphate-dependent acetolactate synthase large subunit-like protein